MKIVIATGGTGGHIMPAIACAEEVRNKDELLFLGTGKPLETKLIVERGYQYQALPAAAVLGKGILGVLKFIVTLPQALFRAISIYKKFSPQVVIGFGGYPSFVPLLAAYLLRIPTVLVELNVQVGLANKVMSLISKKIFAVHGASGFLRGVPHFIENPVRRAFYQVPSFALPKDEEKLRVLVVGGSQGAKRLNDAILSLAPLWHEFEVALVHQVGSGDLARIREAYQQSGFSPLLVTDFIENLASELAAAHLVICRAGAMTVAEVSATGRPAIYVPLPIAGGHQKENTARVVARGGAVVVEEGEGFAERLANKARELLADRQKLAAMAEKTSANKGQETIRSAEAIINGLAELIIEA